MKLFVLISISLILIFVAQVVLTAPEKKQGIYIIYECGRGKPMVIKERRSGDVILKLYRVECQQA